MYFFCKFRGYPVMIYARDKERALVRLVEFVRVTKGNLGYTDEEIKESATVEKCLDFIDDVGYLSKLSGIQKDLEIMKKDIDKALQEKMSEVDKVKRAIRQLYNTLELDDGEYDYWD